LTRVSARSRVWVRVKVTKRVKVRVRGRVRDRVRDLEVERCFQLQRNEQVSFYY
jgi:hypothetical protein